MGNANKIDLTPKLVRPDPKTMTGVNLEKEKKESK